MRQIFLGVACAALVAGSAKAQEVADIAPRAGWAVATTGYDYDTLVERVKAAVGEHGLAVVTEAGPTGAAKARGVTLPGNRVIGAFNNDFAVRILRLSTAAMIEAPVRLYVTENADGTASLSYKLPSAVFAPYADDGGADLTAAIAELDTVFAAIAAEATAR